MVMCSLYSYEVRGKNLVKHQAQNNGKHYIYQRCSVKYKSMRDL